MTKLEKCRKAMKECVDLQKKVETSFTLTAEQIRNVWSKKFKPFQDELCETLNSFSAVFSSEEYYDNDIVLCRDGMISLKPNERVYHYVHRLDEYSDKDIVGIFGRYLANEEVADRFILRCRKLLDRRLSAYLDEAGTMKREWQECLEEISKIQKGEQ